MDSVMWLLSGYWTCNYPSRSQTEYSPFPRVQTQCPSVLEIKQCIEQGLCILCKLFFGSFFLLNAVLELLKCCEIKCMGFNLVYTGYFMKQEAQVIHGNRDNALQVLGHKQVVSAGNVHTHLYNVIMWQYLLPHHPIATLIPLHHSFLYLLRTDLPHRVLPSRPSCSGMFILPITLTTHWVRKTGPSTTLDLCLKHMRFCALPCWQIFEDTVSSHAVLMLHLTNVHSHCLGYRNSSGLLLIKLHALWLLLSLAVGSITPHPDHIGLLELLCPSHGLPSLKSYCR